jgi:hydroxyacylglutathione hydrolase
MPLEILTFVLGPLENNTYAIVDPLTHNAVLVDPSFNIEEAVESLDRSGWKINAVWITHAHFDHIAGVNNLPAAMQQGLSIGLHPLDLPLWQEGGGARMFGFHLGKLPQPNLLFQHGQLLSLGDETVEVRHTPGHSPGHVSFYVPSANTLLSGDVIFHHSIGRTDLPGSDYSQLVTSIRAEVYTLPPETRPLSGHGPATTVAEEITNNPFVRP